MVKQNEKKKIKKKNVYIFNFNVILPTLLQLGPVAYPGARVSGVQYLFNMLRQICMCTSAWTIKVNNNFGYMQVQLQFIPTKRNCDKSQRSD